MTIIHLAISGTCNTTMDNVYCFAMHTHGSVSWHVLTAAVKCIAAHAEVATHERFFFVLALQTPQTELECGSEVDNTVSSPTIPTWRSARDIRRRHHRGILHQKGTKIRRVKNTFIEK